MILNNNEFLRKYFFIYKCHPLHSFHTSGVMGATKDTLLAQLKAIEEAVESEDCLQLDDTSAQLSSKVYGYNSYYTRYLQPTTCYWIL